MPVARIVTRNVSQESPALQQLAERLRAAGYDLELAPPGTGGGGADLLIELDQLPAHEALDGAVRLAQQNDADLFVAPGIFAGPRSAPTYPPPGDLPSQRHSSRGDGSAEAAADSENHARVERGIIDETLQDLGAAVADSRTGIRDSVSSVRARVGSAWEQFQRRRSEASQARRLERERRDVEREERRRQHQFELQRQGEEKQRVLAERERLAAEKERVLREQMAREAAIRAERERTERELMARDAARRAELARAAEQERRSQAAVEAERLRVLREEESQRAAALAAERLRLLREAEVQVPAAPAAVPLPQVFEPALDVTPVLKPRLVRPRRRTPSARERQWQRAAFIASIATVAAMIGYAIAANMRPASPLPASLMQNGAQQQVPFGPAKMDVPSARNSAASKSVTVAQPFSRPNVTRQAGGVPSQRAVSQKPSAAKPVPRRRPRRTSSGNDLVADDEVIVHHAPTSPQRAQSNTGVRRYSDDN